MGDLSEISIYLIGFIWIVIASAQISKYFLKINLPLITGFLLCGIVVGPFALNLVPQNALSNLHFVNDFSLAFIAFAAGSELYLKEMKNSFKSIVWNTFGQLIVTFVVSFFAVYLLADFIPFMKDMNKGFRIAVAILTATIFVARSPSSAIAIINEMRAKGPFPRTALSVTLLKDVLVILLFAISFSLSSTLITGISLNYKFIFFVLFELLLTAGIGYLLSKIIVFVLSIPIKEILKKMLILLLGYSIYLLSGYFREFSFSTFGIELRIEPLLVCLIASFLVINFSKYRLDLQKILHEMGPGIYAIFFTLTGAMMAIDVLVNVWLIALLLFGVRIVSIMIGAFLGSTFAGDPKNYKIIGWMPYITQAGVALALATEIGEEFVPWGIEFATLAISVIVLNQIIGPPLFKWAIRFIGESNLPPKTFDIKHANKTLIFGFEDQSLALARELKNNEWPVKIVSLRPKNELPEVDDIEIVFIDGISLRELNKIGLKLYETFVLMLSDKENYKINELIYENIGKKDVVVRLFDRANINKFHELDSLVVDPSTAIVTLLDHFVRSPIATSLLLGMEENKDTLDIEIKDKGLHGIALRDLRLPADVLILSVKRKGQMIISHGYTRLKRGDIVTIVGSLESIDQVRLQFTV